MATGTRSGLTAAYYKGPDKYRETYTARERAIQKAEVQNFMNRRMLVYNKLKAIKARYKLSDADLDKAGLYPHVLLDPWLHREATTTTAGGEGLLPDIDPITALPRIMGIGRNQAQQANPLEPYGGIAGAAAADEAGLAQQEALARFEEEYRAGRGDSKSDTDPIEVKNPNVEEEDFNPVFPPAQPEPAQGAQPAQPAIMRGLSVGEQAKLNKVRGQFDYSMRQQIKDKNKKRPATEDDVNGTRVRELVLKMLNNAWDANPADPLRIFDNTITQAEQQKILGKVWTNMNDDEQQRILDVFGRYGVQFSSRIWTPDMALEHLEIGIQQNDLINDGLTPLERRANMLSRLRNIFTNALTNLPDDAVLRGKTGSKTVNKIRTNIPGKNWTAAELKARLQHRPEMKVEPIEGQEMQVVPVQIQSDSLDRLAQEMKAADIDPSHINRIRDLLTTGFTNDAWRYYTRNNGGWDNAVLLAYSTGQAELLNIIDEIKRENSGVAFNFNNIRDFMGAIVRTARDIVNPTRQSIRDALTDIKFDIASDVPKEEDAAMPIQVQQQMDMISRLTNVPLTEPIGAEYTNTMRLLESLVTSSRPAGEIARIVVRYPFGGDFLTRVGIGVARPSLAQRRTLLLNANEDDFNEVMEQYANDQEELQNWMTLMDAPPSQLAETKARIIDKILNREFPTSPIRGAPPDPDADPSRITITVGGVRKKIKISAWIAVLIGLGVSVKKIVDHINKLKKEKESAIDIPRDTITKPTQPSKPEDSNEMPSRTARDFRPQTEASDGAQQPPPISMDFTTPVKRRDILTSLDPENNPDAPDTLDWNIPVASRDSLEYTNVSKDFLNSPLGPTYDKLILLPPDPILGAEYIPHVFQGGGAGMDSPKFKEMDDLVTMYNGYASNYNQNIKDYETYKSTGQKSGIWGVWPDKDAAKANDGYAAKLNEYRTKINTAIVELPQAATGRTAMPTEATPAASVTYAFKQYSNGALVKYSEMRQSALSKQLGMEKDVDAYNQAVKDYNVQLDDMVKGRGSSALSGKMPAQPDASAIKAALDNINKGMGSLPSKASRIGRVQSRQIEYSDLDKAVIDRVNANIIEKGAGAKLVLTPDEEKSIRDNPELYQRIEDYKNLSMNASSARPQDLQKLTALKDYFFNIKKNDYKPLSYVKPVSGDYTVDPNTMKEASTVLDQSKSSYNTAQSRLRMAIQSGASRHQINQLYQDADAKKLNYETNRTKYEGAINNYRASLGGQSTFLSNMGAEVLPRTVDERKLFDRLQNVESVLQTNPQALQMYNEKVGTIHKNQNPLDIYNKRLQYLNTISSQFGLSRDYATALNEPLDITVNDALLGADDTTVQLPEEEDTNDMVTRPETLDPAEAKLFISSRAEQVAEQKRWEEFSSVTPFNGLGNTRTNPLLREQVRTYINQFTNNEKGAYPSTEDMRRINTAAVIRRRQLLPSANNAPFIPEVQASFGEEHFENEFAIPSMIMNRGRPAGKQVGNFVIADSNLPNNKYSTWFKPDIYHPEFQLMKYNTDLSASGRLTGPYARDAPYAYTQNSIDNVSSLDNIDDRPQYYSHDTKEYLGKTMSNNFGSRENFNSTINKNNLSGVGALPHPSLTLYDSNTIRQISARRRVR